MTGKYSLVQNINKYLHYKADIENCAANTNVCRLFLTPGERKEEKTEYRKYTMVPTVL